MAKRIKGTHKWKKSGRVPRSIEYGYDTYKKWYINYASKNQMRDDMMNFRQYKQHHKEAREAKINMTNFSRMLASKQRMASETQLLVTWDRVKKQIKEAKKKVKAKEIELKSVIRQDGFIELEDIIQTALPDEYVLLKNYGNITLKEFRLKQREVVEAARATVEDRGDWNAAFYRPKSPKEVAV